MPQTRLHVAIGAAERRRLFPALEAAFEEDGLPLAIFDLDEARGIKEVSLYADRRSRRNRSAGCATVMAELGLDGAIGREVVPDIDWVAKSLEGLKPVRAGRFLVHGSHDRHGDGRPTSRIEIEAGLAFGTGHHGTTAGCLELIETVVRPRAPEKCARPRHRQRRACHRAGEARAYPRAGDRHRSGCHARRRPECRSSTASRRYVRDARPLPASTIRSSRARARST